MTVPVAELRARTGFYAWRAWYDGLADWAPYGKRNPLVRPNVPANIKLFRPTWFPRRAEWWRLRNLLEPAPVLKPELVGVIRTAGNCTVDHEAARAFLEVGGTKVLLQFRDDVNDAVNRAQFPEWASRWRALGIKVSGWWRVNHSPSNVPPSFVGPDDWWPNAEDEGEIARLGEIYRSPCAGVLCKGKQPGCWPPAGGQLGAEAFRENPQSDHTVTNSVRYWRDAGLPLSRLMVLLQAYGIPFSPLRDQAAEARSLGVHSLAIYPLDGADPAAVRSVKQ